MSEWLKEHAWKVCIRVKPYRGFESLSLRHTISKKRMGRFAETAGPCVERERVRTLAGSTNRQEADSDGASRPQGEPQGRGESIPLS